jgi:hypothetical protein
MSTIPNEFLCPIGLTIMKDPAIGPDGHTYELTAITEWLLQHDVSPITRQQMSVNRLRPNIALRKMIEDWLVTHPQFSGVPPPAPLFKDVPLSISAKKYNGLVHLQVAATGPAQRQPIVFIAIVDNSGSMGEEASGGDGGESFGFTRMDLVKHTINTMAAILGPQDQLSIVTFSTNANVVLPPTFVDDAGRSKIQKALETVEPDSQTNIYDGIRMAAMIANQPDLAGRNIVAALLTDGFPNVNPPRGILETLKLMPKQPSWSLHTFGFGYKLDSRLLADIAEWGNGLFGFIPDCSMVGTVFINFIANMLTTASLGATLFVDGKRISFTGPIRHGQTHDQVIMFTDGMKQVSVDGENYVEIEDGAYDEFTSARNDYIDVLKTMIDTASSAPLAAFRSKYEKTTDDRVKGFLVDTDPKLSSEGQVSMSTKFWSKWGEHYLRSYYRAQQLQQSLNFKDAGLQIYGGDLFHAIQTEADTAFCTLPAPKPSALPKPVAAAGYYGAAAAYQSPATMVSFHNPSGGCFAGTCQVKMASGRSKAIKDVEPGDGVWTPMGPATVTALVTCGSKARSQPMVQLDRLCITPWHPIINPTVNGNKAWVFPADLVPLQDRLIDTVYNLVLDSGHVVDVEGYECVTLGHGFQAPVVKHEFFGTEAVINDLKKLPGWSVGRPVFKNLVTMRDDASGLIVGWVDKP